MKTRLLDTTSKRISIAVAILTGVVAVGAAIFFFSGNDATTRINGPQIIAAARAYTKALRDSHAQPQATVSVQTLIDKGLLRQSDVGALQGMDAKIYLVAAGPGPGILMQVRMPDGSDLVLLQDGRIYQVKK